MSRPVLRTFIHVLLAGPGATSAGAAGSYAVELDAVMTRSPVCLVYFYQVSHWKLQGFVFYVISLSPHSLCQLSLFFPGAGMKMPTGGNHTSTQDGCAICCAPHRQQGLSGGPTGHQQDRVVSLLPKTEAGAKATRYLLFPKGQPTLLNPGRKSTWGGGWGKAKNLQTHPPLE